jgi:hypothetical protein
VPDPAILLRMKEDYDGAEPAASSVAVANLYRLAGYASTSDAHGWGARRRRPQSSPRPVCPSGAVADTGRASQDVGWGCRRKGRVCVCVSLQRAC